MDKSEDPTDTNPTEFKSKDPYYVKRRAYYLRNLDKITAQQRERHKKNREKSNMQCREYYHKNRAKLKLQAHEYYIAHRAKQRRLSCEYHIKHRDQIRAQVHEFRIKNLDYVRAREKRWRDKNRIHLRAQRHEYQLKNRERLQRQRKERYAVVNLQLRLKVLRIVSGLENPVCESCGCDDARFLEVNHLNGGGGRETRKLAAIGTDLRRQILTGKRSVEDLNVYCRPCNAVYYLKLKYGDDKHVILWKK